MTLMALALSSCGRKGDPQPPTASAPPPSEHIPTTITVDPSLPGHKAEPQQGQ